MFEFHSSFFLLVYIRYIAIKTSQFVRSLFLLIVTFFFITETESCILWGGNLLTNGNQLGASMDRTFLGEDFSKNFFIAVWHVSKRRKGVLTTIHECDT